MSRTRHRRDRHERDAGRRRAAVDPLPCAVCALPYCTRLLVDLALANCDSLTLLARATGLSRGQLRRHADRCHRGRG
jgi:hypothetical protein